MLLKFLAAYLGSPIATFLLIMTGFSVIGERPRVALEDLKTFPFCAPDQHPDRNRAQEIVAKVAVIFDTLAAVPEWQRDHAHAAVKATLDELIFDYFQLSDNDRLLIRDIVGVVALSIQPQDYARLTTPLLHRPAGSEVTAYVDVLARELEAARRRSGGRGALKVEAVVDGTKGFFGAVRIGLSDADRDRSSIARSEDLFQALLEDIHGAFSSQLDKTRRNDLFKMPNAMIVAGDAFYFIKPMRRRFWLARAALADADLIARTVQTAAWEKLAS